MPDNRRPPTKTLRLEYHDLLSLFEFLDNGDGQITLLCSIRKGRLESWAVGAGSWKMMQAVEIQKYRST